MLDQHEIEENGVFKCIPFLTLIKIAGRCTPPQIQDDLIMIPVDFIQMDNYPSDSFAISPTAFLLSYLSHVKKSK